MQICYCRCPWLPLCQPAKLVYSDASDYACGSFIHSEGKIFQQNWSPVERNNSSTWRELKAVDLALISFAPSLLGKQVAWFTDNTNVVSIVHSGSKVTELQDLALRIFHVCVSSGISLEMKWIPRDLNSFADHLSRIIDFDDYTINDDVFHILDVRWGPHTIDRFACSYNAKLSRFNSRFYQPGAEAVDAFFTRLYGRAFRKWKEFALRKKELSYFPANPMHVAVYLQYVLESTRSSASVDTAFYSIKWAHESAGLVSPTDSQDQVVL